MQNSNSFDIYAYCIQHFPRRTFLEAADDIFTGKNHLHLDYNYPYKEFFYVAEDDVNFTEAKKSYFIDLLRLEERFYNE